MIATRRRFAGSLLAVSVALWFAAAGTPVLLAQGDSPQSAAEITVNRTVSGQFGRFADNHYYRFAAQRGLSYTIATSNLTSGLDTILQLRSADGRRELAEDDDGAGDGRASRIMWTCPADADYVVVVSAFVASTGTYNLLVSSPDHVDEEDVPIEGSDPGHAIAVAVGSLSEGELPDGHGLWYRFIARVGETYRVEVLLAGDCTMTDSVLGLFDDDGRRKIAGDDDGGEGLGSRLTHTARESGVLFAYVGGFKPDCCGSFMLEIGRANGETPGDGDGDPTPEGSAGASPAAAKMTRVGEPERGTINRHGEVDTYALYARAGMRYTIRLELGTLRRGLLTLVSTDGETILDADDNAGTREGSRIELAPTVTGTYFFSVRGLRGFEQGTYTVTCDEIDD